MKISWGQTFVILLSARLFALMTCTPVTSDKNPLTVYMIGVLISTAIQAALIIPFLFLKNKFPDKSVTEIASLKGGFFSFIVSIIYFVFFFSSAIISVTRFEKFVGGVFFEKSSMLTGTFILIASAVYGSYSGIQGIARTSGIIFALFCFYIILQPLSSLNSINFLNLTFRADLYSGSILTAVMDDFSQSSQIILLAVLLPYLKNLNKGIAGYLIGKLVSVEIILFFAVTILGGYVSLVDYPFFSLAGFAVNSNFERLDAIYIFVWVLISFVNTSLLIFALSNIINSFFCETKSNEQHRKKKNIRGFLCKYRNSIAGLIILLGSVPVFMKFTVYEDILKGIISAIPMIVLILIIPAILLLIRGENNENKNNSCPVNDNASPQRL